MIYQRPLEFPNKTLLKAMCHQKKLFHANDEINCNSVVKTSKHSFTKTGGNRKRGGGKE